MKGYVPEKIDIDKLSKDCQESHIKGFHPGKMVWILSEIAEKPTTSNGFVEIHSKRLQSFVHNYKDYLECFDSSGIIERDLSSDLTFLLVAISALSPLMVILR